MADARVFTRCKYLDFLDLMETWVAILAVAVAEMVLPLQLQLLPPCHLRLTLRHLLLLLLPPPPPPPPPPLLLLLLQGFKLMLGPFSPDLFLTVRLLSLYVICIKK